MLGTLGGLFPAGAFPDPVALDISGGI